MKDFLSPNNFFLWISVFFGLFYGFAALKIQVLGGNPSNLKTIDRAHQFFVNFPGGFLVGYFLWLLYRNDFIAHPALGILLIVLTVITISGYFAHFIINILLAEGKIIDLIKKALGI